MALILQSSNLTTLKKIDSIIDGYRIQTKSNKDTISKEMLLEMLELEEDDLFNRERKAFLNLAKTQPTLQRISSLIEKGISIRN